MRVIRPRVLLTAVALVSLVACGTNESDTGGVVASIVAPPTLTPDTTGQTATAPADSSSSVPSTTPMTGTVVAPPFPMADVDGGQRFIAGDGPGTLVRLPVDACEPSDEPPTSYIQSWYAYGDGAGGMLVIETAETEGDAPPLPGSLAPWTYELVGEHGVSLRDGAVTVSIDAGPTGLDVLDVARALRPRDDSGRGWQVPAEWGLRPVADDVVGRDPCTIVRTGHVVDGQVVEEVRIVSDAESGLAPLGPYSLVTLLAEHDELLVAQYDTYTEAWTQIPNTRYYLNVVLAGPRTLGEIHERVDAVRLVTAEQVAVLPEFQDGT